MREAVIFDFDGVLVDSEPAHMDAILRTIREVGWDADPGELFRDFVGTSDRHCFEVLGERHGEAVSGERMDALMACKLRHFLAAVEGGRVRAHEGAFELVRGAAGRVPVVVCSGSIRATIEPVLARFGVLDVIRGIVAADDVQHTKPDPEPYRRAAELAGAAPSACVAVEDTDHGIASAKGAGVAVVAVRHSCPDDRLARADRVVDRIGELTAGSLLGV